MPKRIVFLDRDGTINIDKGYIYKFEDFELIEGSLNSLKLLSNKGYLIYIITNQSGIARGFFNEEQYLEFTRKMLSFFAENQIRIKDVFYCPHLPNGKIQLYNKVCHCRKPNIELFLRALQEEQVQKEDCEMTIIGDKISDIEAGIQLGGQCYLIDDKIIDSFKERNENFIRVKNLQIAVLDLVEKDNS